MSEWQSLAKCRDSDPELYDLSSSLYGRLTQQQRVDTAAALCSDCPVMAECAVEAIHDMSVGVVRAGIELPLDRSKLRRGALDRLRAVAWRSL